MQAQGSGSEFIQLVFVLIVVTGSGSVGYYYCYDVDDDYYYYYSSEDLGTSPWDSARFLRGSRKEKGRLPRRVALTSYIWVVVKIMVPFWVPIIIRHLLFRVPKKGP